MSRLKKFLKKNGVFENFASNLNKDHRKGVVNKFLKENANNPQAISNAFDWSNTPEGDEMWNRVSATWYMKHSIE